MTTAVLSLRDIEIGPMWRRHPIVGIWRPPIRPTSVDTAAIDFDPEAERQRHILMGLIARLVSEGDSWAGHDPAVIDAVTATTALAFVLRLPPDRALPKVSPDGEGGVMFVWDSGAKTVMVTVDGSVLLTVVDPGRPTSTHLLPVPFDGDVFPAELLTVLPSR